MNNGRETWYSHKTEPVGFKWSDAMPGPDKDTKKKIGEAKKKVEGEIKKLAKKTKKPFEEAKILIEEEKAAQKAKDKSPDAKKKAAERNKKLKQLFSVCRKETEKTSKAISLQLKDYVPEDKTEIKLWQKDMAPWYRDIVNKEPGWSIGGDLRVNGDLSIKDKKGMITISGKFWNP